MSSEYLTLAKIGVFNPGRLSDAEIESAFVSRIPLFQYIFKKITAEPAGSIPQHHLLVGQRGMGKTTMLMRLAAELRKEPYKNDFIPLNFPEEQYNIDKLAKFFLNCLDALADALDKEKQAMLTAELDAEIQTLVKQQQADANTVFAVFEKWIKKINRRPVLLVDNLNLVFDKISQAEQHQLRAILMSNGAPIMMGASASLMDEVNEYSAPFYDAFQISYLKKLSFAESLDILRNLATLTNKAHLGFAASQHRGRLEALYHLAGGTPRTIVLLFPLIQEGFSTDIQTDLDALLDMVTPLYKARFEELSPQLQIVLDATALHWDPISLEQLREVTQLGNNVVGPQLKRLVDTGWLEKLKSGEVRGNLYELSERFFNIWYLMRRSSRRQKRELYCLSRFLETFYGQEVQTIALRRLACENNSSEHIAIDLALAEALKDGELREKLRKKNYLELLRLSRQDKDILKNFEIPGELLEKEGLEILNDAIGLLYKEEYDLAIEKINHVNSLIGENQLSYGLLDAIYSKKGLQEVAERYSTALSRLGGEDNEFLWLLLGKVNHLALENYKLAEEDYRRVLNINAKNIEVCNLLGLLYRDRLHNYSQAEQAFLKGIAIKPKSLGIWLNLGVLYAAYQNRYQEAEKAYLNAIKINKNHFYSWQHLGHLYTNSLQRFEEAEKAYLQAISLNPKLSSAWNHLGNLYSDHLHNYAEAEKAYQMATTLDSDAVSEYNLIFLYRDKTGQIAKAKELFDNLKKTEELADSYWLNAALFDYYEGNTGLAKNHIIKALEHIKEELPQHTKDDWWRAGAVIAKLGYTNHYLSILESTGHDIILRPYYEAIKAFEKGNELYFNSLAAEVREPAKIIYQQMLRYNKGKD